MDSTSEQYAWIIALITMVGAIFGGLFKLISKNGCAIKCYHANGKPCCSTDCDLEDTEGGKGVF